MIVGPRPISPIRIAKFRRSAKLVEMRGVELAGATHGLRSDDFRRAIVLLPVDGLPIDRDRHGVIHGVSGD